MVQAREYMDELGVHVEACTNEASAALSNLSSPGVAGDALIVVGEDYGEGASVTQERTHAFAMKSGMCLIDPRPDLPTIVRMVGQGFELSEASNTPVTLQQEKLNVVYPLAPAQVAGFCAARRAVLLVEEVQLEGTLAQAGIKPLPPREQPIRWMKKPRAPARAVVPSR